MDPLSACASLLAVLGATHKSVKALRTLNRSWKARQLLTDLATKVENLKSTLQDISSFLKSSHATSLSIDADGHFRRANDISSRISNLLSSTQLWLVWLRHKHEIEEHWDELRDICLHLTLILVFFNATSAARVENSLSLLARQLSPVDGQGRVSPATLESLTLLCDHEVEPEEALAPLSSQDRSITLSALDPLSSRPQTATSVDPNTESHPFALLPSPETCAVYCSCDCHTQNNLTTPWILRSWLGRLDVKYAIQPPLCNERKCKRPSSSQLSINYLFPRYLLGRSVSLLVGSKPLYGIPSALRFPRVCRISHRLFKFAKIGDLAAIEELFNRKLASPYDLNPFGSNSLMYALKNRDLSVFRFLVLRGADLWARADTGQTPAEKLWDRALAGHYGSEGVSEVYDILKSAEDVWSRRFTILHKIVLGLLARKLRSELEVSTAAINQGDSLGRTPLAWAVFKNDLHSVNTLLSFGADPNICDISGFSPLDNVQSVSVCQALLKSQANIHSCKNSYRSSALHRLCEGPGSVEVIDLLVEAGIDVNVRDNDDVTPLLSAAFTGSSEKVKRLLELGADVNAKSLTTTDRPLNWAIHHNRHDVVPLLLEHGADYHAVCKFRRNIAHTMTRSADTKMIKLLTQSKLVGLDVHLRDVDGKTPIDYLPERPILVPGEDGVHEAFQEFMRSV